MISARTVNQKSLDALDASRGKRRRSAVTGARVILVLAERTVALSITTLARLLHLSRAHVRRTCQDLVEADILVTSKRSSSGPPAMFFRLAPTHAATFNGPRPETTVAGLTARQAAGSTTRTPKIPSSPSK